MAETINADATQMMGSSSEVMIELQDVDKFFGDFQALKGINMKVGKQETMIVIRVDREKRYIDLSKKQVKVEEAQEREQYFKKAKMVHNIMKEVAVKLKVKLEDLYEQFGWDLYDKFNHAYDAFKVIMTEPESVYSTIEITEE